MAPTWGPQPWHGYSIAVWFSSGPWSKQTSFALLLRSCRKRQNIARQTSSGGAAAAPPPFHSVMVPATPWEGQTTPHMRTKARVWEAIPPRALRRMPRTPPCACDPPPRSSPCRRHEKGSQETWTWKRWSPTGYPKWASAPTLVSVTQGITGQLLRSLLARRHENQK